MTYNADMRPRLRPVEAFHDPKAGPDMVTLRDPSRLSPAALTVSEPVLFILSHFDGEHNLREIADAFSERFHQPLPPNMLDEIVTHLREAYLLDDESFEAYYQSFADKYAAGHTRVMRNAKELDIDANIGRIFDALMLEVGNVDGDASITGIIAPHLDYPRGAPCYAAAYARLRNRPVPRRIVILGANHFGRSLSVVVTGKDFETPLGRTKTDVEFIEQLELRCGDLRRNEFDHQREHSVELQLLWCQHVFGPERFSIVPVLCPDPCGPTGTKPYDGNGVDLRDFAETLGECVRQNGEDTLLIASADLSHIGAHFGDGRKLEDSFLLEVRQRDERALRAVEQEGAEAFLAHVAEDGNPTRICSAGCIYALMTALPDAKARSVKYHQAIHEESQTGVTCATVLLTR